MRYRSANTTQATINVVGSSTFGVYPKISQEKTYNMYITDGWMIPYLGYKSIATLGDLGRGIFTSNVLNQMVVVVDNKVYLLDVVYNKNQHNQYTFTPEFIGFLQTFKGDVYFAENNAGQILLSDRSNLYVYNRNASPTFQILTSTALGFVPGFISFHDTYFLCAASNDTFASPPANNSWRLSTANDGTSWPADASHVGLLETKPDNTQAVLRFPSRGNMIFVFGENVVEPWFDQGSTLFPYQRSTSSSIDYGCINPSTIAWIDEHVVWLAQNEKSGPLIVYSDGGMTERISSDGIDELLGSLLNPADSEAFMFRSAGHIFYHINFYTDNISLFYDFNTQKFFHASDEKGNYFIAKDVAFFNNQYYFVSKNDGNVYAFDLSYTTYNGEEIPRIRVCKSIRMPTQDYFIANDCGFTIEMGTTEPIYYNYGPCFLITQDGKPLITEGGDIFLESQDGKMFQTEDNQNLLVQTQSPSGFAYLITNQDCISEPIYPRVDMSISRDGGQSFGSYVSYPMNALGKGVNMLRWWQLGVANDFIPQFRFWGLGRFVAYDGILNVRQ